MDLFDALAKRYSYRGSFTDAPLPRDDLVKIVQAGIQAPSAKNEQTTSFVIVDDPGLLGQIAALLDRPVCGTARAMIACVIDPRPVADRPPSRSRIVRPPWKTCCWPSPRAGIRHGLARLRAAARRPGGPDQPAAGRPPRQDVRILLPLGVAASPGRQKEKLPFAARAWFNRCGGNP